MKAFSAIVLLCASAASATSSSSSATSSSPLTSMGSSASSSASSFLSSTAKSDEFTLSNLLSSTSSSSSIGDQCFCTDVETKDKVCLFLDHSEPSLLLDDDDSSLSSSSSYSVPSLDDDDDLFSGFRPSAREGDCLECGCNSKSSPSSTSETSYESDDDDGTSSSLDGAGPSSSSSSSSKLSASDVNRDFRPGGACHFATYYSAECRRCGTEAEDFDEHCTCYGMDTSDAIIVPDIATPAFGRCVAVARDVRIEGTFAMPDSATTGFGDSLIVAGRLVGTATVALDDVAGALTFALLSGGAVLDGGSTIQLLNAPLGTILLQERTTSLAAITTSTLKLRMYQAENSFAGTFETTTANYLLLALYGQIGALTLTSAGLGSSEVYVGGCAVVAGIQTLTLGTETVVYGAASGAVANDDITLTNAQDDAEATVRFGFAQVSGNVELDFTTATETELNVVVYSNAQFGALATTASVNEVHVHSAVAVGDVVFDKPAATAGSLVAVFDDDVLVGDLLVTSEPYDEVAISFGHNAHVGAVAVTNSQSEGDVSVQFGPRAVVQSLTITADGDVSVFATSSTFLDSVSLTSTAAFTIDVHLESVLVNGNVETTGAFAVVTLSGTRVLGEVSLSGDAATTEAEVYLLCGNELDTFASTDFVDGVVFISDSTTMNALLTGSAIQKRSLGKRLTGSGSMMEPEPYSTCQVPSKSVLLQCCGFEATEEGCNCGPKFNPELCAPMAQMGDK